MNAILAEWDRRQEVDKRWLAYMLATAFHETGGRMQPVRENVNYTSASQIKKTWPTRFASIGTATPFVRQPQKLANKVYGRLGNTAPNDGWTYGGDGLPQLTGKENFQKFDVEPGMDMETAVRVMFDGMIKGLFTGRKLADYSSRFVDEPVGARRIVNGNDKATLIAGYHKNFLDAIQAAQDKKRRDDVKPADAKPMTCRLGRHYERHSGGGGLLVTLLTGLNILMRLPALP